MLVRSVIAPIYVSVLAIVCQGNTGLSQMSEDQPWSQRIAQSFVARHPGAVTYDSISPDQKWNYEQGLMLVALYKAWKHTGDQTYFNFVKENLDHYVQQNGTIISYKRSDYNLDNIGPGRALLWMFEKTKEEKFRFAADTLRRQLTEQPRTREGGFWHKKIYPFQMWLDGLFMAEPFYAMYASLFEETGAFDDIAQQFMAIVRHTRDPKTGLYYHGWDESKQQKWANVNTGCSPNFWARAMGWFAMGLVDVLDYFPEDQHQRSNLVQILNDLAEAITRFQDSKSGVWYQVVDQGEREGNYLEASASCMFAYTLAKGVNRELLPPAFLDNARRAFNGITEHFVSVDENGFVDLHQICRSAGLGGNPYRDGSFEYYISEPKRLNDMKGYGSFLLAAIEIEKAGVDR